MLGIKEYYDILVLPKEHNAPALQSIPNLQSYIHVLFSMNAICTCLTFTAGAPKEDVDACANGFISTADKGSDAAADKGSLLAIDSGSPPPPLRGSDTGCSSFFRLVSGVLFTTCWKKEQTGERTSKSVVRIVGVSTYRHKVPQGMAVRSAVRKRYCHSPAF